MSLIYVGMTDTFMSGWGEAEGRTNRYVVACKNGAQAEQIKQAARKRSEMKKISVSVTEPKSNAQRLVSLKYFDELGEIWTGGVK